MVGNDIMIDRMIWYSTTRTTLGTGFMCANELEKLHEKLGEPISPEDAAQAMVRKPSRTCTNV